MILTLKGILSSEEEVIRRRFEDFLQDTTVNPFNSDVFALMTVGEVLDTSDIDPLEFWQGTEFNTNLITNVLSKVYFRFVEDDCPECGHEMEDHDLTKQCPYCGHETITMSLKDYNRYERETES